MRATRDWIPPTSYKCPDCGQTSPTWICDCHPLPGQLTIDEELETP